MLLDIVIVIYYSVNITPKHSNSKYQIFIIPISYPSGWVWVGLAQVFTWGSSQDSGQQLLWLEEMRWFQDGSLTLLAGYLNSLRSIERRPVSYPWPLLRALWVSSTITTCQLPSPSEGYEKESPYGRKRDGFYDLISEVIFCTITFSIVYLLETNHKFSSHSKGEN